MKRTRVIDVDAIKEKDKISVPVVDLEKNQQDEEIILVGEKRKKSDQQYRRNKRRKIELSDDSSVRRIMGRDYCNIYPSVFRWILFLFEQKEREFQRIRSQFVTTDPLLFLPFEIIEQICCHLRLKNYGYLLCINKAWYACREVLPWKYLCSKMFDVTLMAKLKGTWHERLKFKLLLEQNWSNDTREQIYVGNKYGNRLIQLPADTIIWKNDFDANKTEFFKLLEGTKIEKVLETKLIWEENRFVPAPVIYMAPIHVFHDHNKKTIGYYQSDREWNRTSARLVSRWTLESSEQTPSQISLEDIFNKKVAVKSYQEEDLFGVALDVEADCSAQFMANTSSFFIDKITTGEKITETDPILASQSFFHINGDFILYLTPNNVSPSNQLKILNWKTNEATSLDLNSTSADRVALALPKGLFNNNNEYTLFADSDRLILINLNDATVVRSYICPPRFKPAFLQLWPYDKTKFFSVGSVMHIWSVFESRIKDSLMVQTIHPLSNNEAYPIRVKFHDNKIFLQYQTVSHVLCQTNNGSYERMNSFKDDCYDFDECHLFSAPPFMHRHLTISDFTPKISFGKEQNTDNTNQSNINTQNRSDPDVQVYEIID